MTHTPQLRIAVIGVGAMGRGHCRTIREQVPELSLAAVVDAHAGTAASAGAQFDVPHFTSAEEMIKAGCTDAALVAVPHPLHADAVVACAQAKLHVLCEKPLADAVSAADRMVRAVHENGVAFAVMFNRRFEPVVEAMFDFARAGRLGTLRRTLLIAPDFRTQRYYDSNPWRATWRGEGGGVLLNQAPHLIDLFTQTAGLPIAVRGHVETRLHDIEVEDHAEAMLRYDGGGTGYISCSTNEPRHSEQLEVVGDRGKLVLRRQELACYTFAEGLRDLAAHSEEVWGRPQVDPFPITVEDLPSGHFSVLRNFARHILFNEPLHCEGESGLASLELANAITLSSYTGREVTLPIDRGAYDALLHQRREQSTYRKREVLMVRETDPQFK